MIKSISLALGLAFLASPPTSHAEPFRFHLLTETTSLDPQTATSANGNYVFHLIYRGLFRYRSHEGLRPAGAQKCQRSALRLICKLNPAHKWSDGKAVAAADYVAAFRRLINPATSSPHADMITSLKNARTILKSGKSASELGVSAPDSRTLVFEFAEEDPEFEYKLIHPALSPLPPSGFPERSEAHTMPTSGPYKVEQWKTGSFVRFTPNLFYDSKSKRPPAEAWIVDDDSTALRMYESGKLNFLRRLTATEIPRFKDSPEFHQIPQARFDYVGFGPELATQTGLREALMTSVDYPTYLRVIASITPPGCPGLPAPYLEREGCLAFDLKRAKSLLNAPPARKLEFFFSRMGGDDIARGAEWFQGQWRKNLGVETELRPQEQSIYLAQLKTKPPAIFRKGVSLDRPTCMAGLELFTKDNPENYIRLNDPEYDRLVRSAGQAEGVAARKKACSIALRRLMESHRLIPLGQSVFTILAKTRFQGWDLNELNQLDLSDLEERAN